MRVFYACVIAFRAAGPGHGSRHAGVQPAGRIIQESCRRSVPQPADLVGSDKSEHRERRGLRARHRRHVLTGGLSRCREGSTSISTVRRAGIGDRGLRPERSTFQSQSRQQMRPRRGQEGRRQDWPRNCRRGEISTRIRSAEWACPWVQHLRASLFYDSRLVGRRAKSNFIFSHRLLIKRMLGLGVSLATLPPTYGLS